MLAIQIPPEPAAIPARSWDLTRGLIDATVQLDQPDGNGRRTVGTGFLIAAPRPDGTPRTVLVTAAHVLERMPDSEARIGWRLAFPEGGWRFTPEPLRIRESDLTPVWTRHPDHDIAVMEVVAPEAFARAAIPVGWLGDADAFDAWQVGPGDELLSLGFPRGLSANRAGFPILRVGRIASWPLTPISAFSTFLLDFPVHAGDSGGPVFWTPSARRLPGTVTPDHPFIAGVLVQTVEVDGQGLGIGVVAHAQYVREAIALMDAAPGP